MKKYTLNPAFRLFWSIVVLLLILGNQYWPAQASATLTDLFNFTTLQFTSSDINSVAVYEAGNKVFVGDAANNAIIVLNGTTNQVITTIAGVPGGGGGGMVVNETYGKVYFHTATNTGVINASTNQVLSMSLPKGYLVSDEVHDKLYIVNGDAANYSVQVVNVATDAASALYSGSGNFTDAEINPVTNELAVLIYYPAKIDFINVNTHAVYSANIASTGGNQALDLATNTIENKYYVTLIKIPGQGEMGIFVFDRDTKSYSFAGKSDLEPLVFNPTSNTLFSGVQVGKIMGVIDGFTDEFTPIDVRSNSNGGHGAGGARYSTDHAYFTSQDQITFVDNHFKTADFISLPIASRGGAVSSDIAVNQTSGKVYVIADNQAGKVFVLQDPPANGVGTMIQDGSFESGASNPYWMQYSSLGYGHPLICNAASCGGGAAHTGSLWTAFGGNGEDTEISQTGIIPASQYPTALTFWLQIPSAGSLSGNDTLSVEVDGHSVYQLNGNKASVYNTYKKVILDISAFADGGLHKIRFISFVTTISNPGSVFYVDDIALETGPSLQFTNDDRKHPVVITNLPYTNTQNTGTATLAPDDPILPCISSRGYNTVWYSFFPAISGTYSLDTFGSTFSYNTVLGVWTSNMLSLGCNDNTTGFQAQVEVSLVGGRTYYIEVAGYGAGDYGNLTLNLNAVSPPNMDVVIGGSIQGSYYVPPYGSLRKSYDALDNGPVKVVNTDGDPIIASERINLKSNPTFSSYAEIMGIPASKLTDQYIFPWYNNTGLLDSQLRFGNVGNVSTTVTIKIGGITQIPSYTLDPNESTRVSLNLDKGPVEVKSSNGVPIIAALRINLKKNAIYSSYSEFLGMSASSVVATRYIFPWYNNTGLLDSQLRFGNVGNTTTTVTVRIGGNVQSPTYTLAPNQSTRVSYNLDSGPVEITSSNGVPITAAMRVNLKSNALYSSYTELMGLPGVTLTDTRYLFPWYNNTGLLDSQLRFANVGNATTTITIKVNGVVWPTTYTLAPNKSTRVSLSNVNNGPVEVYSSGNVPIIAAMRINLKTNDAYSSYYEFMGSSAGAPLGLPGNQLSSTYWFPWYNNTGLLDSQLRFGLP